jgi:uncharacterized small protein (DUF1192 family)
MGAGRFLKGELCMEHGSTGTEELETLTTEELQARVSELMAEMDRERGCAVRWHTASEKSLRALDELRRHR